MRKAVQSIPGYKDIPVYVHEIGFDFCVCEHENGQLALLPTPSIRFTEPLKEENTLMNISQEDFFTALFLAGNIANTGGSPGISPQHAMRFTENLITLLEEKKSEKTE